jgi:hypothetical protein
MIVVRFYGYIFHLCPWYLTTEVVEAVVLFEIKAWDEAIHEAVVVGEMTVKFVDKVEDRAEVAVDTSAVATMKVRSTEG